MNFYDYCHNAKQLNNSTTSVSDYLFYINIYIYIYIQKKIYKMFFFWCEICHLLTGKYAISWQVSCDSQNYCLFLCKIFRSIKKNKNGRKVFERERRKRKNKLLIAVFPKLLGGWDDPVNTNMHAYTHTHMHACTHTRTHTHTHTQTHTHRRTHTRTHAHTHTHTHTQTHTHTHTHTQTHTHTHRHTHTHTHTQTHTDTHTQTHTHTHTHTHTSRLCRRKGFTPTPLHSINP